MNKSPWELWDTVKKPNLQIFDVEVGTEVQTNIIENLFNKIIAENFLNPRKDIGIQV